ncbi:MAG: hypothetical protein LV480_01535 [Methylacidiphilales bacterium]|nr:hypothetical protein [Candidatus Methylacidiphilales bacterium]
MSGKDKVIADVPVVTEATKPEVDFDNDPGYKGDDGDWMYARPDKNGVWRDSDGVRLL